jgi:hypothetical protein
MARLSALLPGPVTVTLLPTFPVTRDLVTDVFDYRPARRWPLLACHCSYCAAWDAAHKRDDVATRGCVFTESVEHAAVIRVGLTIR